MREESCYTLLMITLGYILANPERYFSVKEVSTALKVSRQSVLRWVVNKKLSGFIIGKQYAVKGSEVKSYLDKLNEN